MKRYILLAVALFLSAVVACNSGPRSPVGFRLPDGNVEKGKTAFLELHCYSCHRVSGVGLPPPTGEIREPVYLGGQVFAAVTDGYLTTSIMHPSYKLASGYAKERIAMSGGISRMPNHRHGMTVHQLIDLVAFLQSSYSVVYQPQPVF